jgi:hypothetical protein
MFKNVFFVKNVFWFKNAYVFAVIPVFLKNIRDSKVFKEIFFQYLDFS